MKVIQTIGAANVIIGVAWLLAPMKFYSAAMALFTPEVSPPFDSSAITTVTFLLLLPAIIFILNGIALIFMGSKFDRVPELKVFKETGEYMGRVSGLEERRGEIERFLMEDDDEVREKEDILAMDDVVLLKDDLDFESEFFEGEKHELSGMEVYDRDGRYYGKVRSVTLDENQNATEFLVMRGESKRIVKIGEVESTDEVVIIKI